MTHSVDCPLCGAPCEPGNTWGAAKVNKDAHIAYACPEATDRDRRKAKSRNHWT